MYPKNENKIIKITFINIHTLTEDKEEKENFCTKLERAYDMAPNSNTIILGDINDKN